MYLTTHCLALLAFCFFSGLRAQIQTFLSRPDLEVPVLIILHNDTRSSPGYWFFSPWGGSCQLAPYIYDNRGELVWSGRSPETGSRFWDLRVFEFANQSVRLSSFRGTETRGHGDGHFVLLDETYSIRKTLLPDKQGRSLDFHDFRIFDGGKTAIVFEYLPVRADLSSKGVRRGLGWVFDGVFKEIDFESGKTLFEWHSIDHVPVTESHVRPRLEVGAGLSFAKPWDYFHINSLDKYPNGDYLISARHADCIYRISGKDGSIIWKLGGADSSFILQGFNFSAQHDARLRLTPMGREQISFYNNAWNGGEGRTRNYSSAMLIDINTFPKPMVATLVKEWLPSHGGLARHQGNVQYLPNGNVFIGWGGIPQFSEFTPEGERVLDVAFADEDLLNYRVWKFPWMGRPDTLPDLYMYALSAKDDTHFYMSWNGATEVHSWDIYGLDRPDIEGKPVRLGMVEKGGFETHFVVDRLVKFGYIEALDEQGKLLARSEVKSIFIPQASFAKYCGKVACAIAMEKSKVQDKDAAAEPSAHGWELQVVSSDVGGFDVPLKGWWTIFLGASILLLIGFYVGRLSHGLKGMRRITVFVGITQWLLKKLGRGDSVKVKASEDAASTPFI